MRGGAASAARWSTAQRWIASHWGVGRAYLCARPRRTAFYERLGWRPIERDVGPHSLSVFIRDANPEAGKLNSPP
jgi:hypothetical protein